MERMTAPTILETRRKLAEKLEKILEKHDKKWLEDDHYRELSELSMIATARQLYGGKFRTKPLPEKTKQKLSDAAKQQWVIRKQKQKKTHSED